MIQAASFLIALIAAGFIFVIDTSWGGLAGACCVSIAIGYVGACIEDWIDPPLLDDIDEGKSL